MPDSTLSPERWNRIQELFHEALDVPPDQRGAFLDASCKGDAELRGAVASLLAAEEHSDVGDRVAGHGPSVQDTVAEALAERYEIEGPIGRGGMATVFVARDLKHSRKVAIKVLRPELTFGVERFLREIEIAAGLQHPHILPLFDSGAADGLLFYVMPYVEGSTLALRMDREGALPLDDTLQIASDVLSALDYAHRRGVVHRDIKPSNILLSRATGHALVADFGIARAISAAEGDGLTAPGVAIGTPGYMPPEQARGETITAGTDIYSTALVLHECLTGRPYTGEVTGRSNWEGVPSHVRQALQRALREDPDERWPDAGAFRRALLTQHARATSLRLWAAVVAALVVLFGGWWTLGRSGTAVVADESRLAVLPFSVSGIGELLYLGEGVVDLLSTKLDGAGSWRTVDPRAVISLVNNSGSMNQIDPALGRSIAQQLGASWYVLGNIVEVGDRVQLDASLYGPGPGIERIGTASAEGEATAVLELLDRLAADLLSTQPNASDARLTRLAAVTTRSLPALKSYLRGAQALRLGEYPVATTAFQEALALDSTFALAWYQLSVTSEWMMRTDIAFDAAEQAVRFADRLSERDRRLLEALGTIRFGDFEDAEEQYRSILATYPEEIEAWSQLGELLFHFGPRMGYPLENSREAWTRLIELEPNQAGAYIHLARIEASRSNLPALDSVTRRALQLAPEGDRGAEMRVFRAFVVDDARARERIMSDLRLAPPDVFAEVIWTTGTFIRDLNAVRTVLEVAAESQRIRELQVVAQSALAFVEAGAGRWRASAANLDRMRSVDPVSELREGAILALIRGLVRDTTWLREYHDRLFTTDWSNVPPSTNRSSWFAVLDTGHRHFRWYLLGAIAAMLGNSEEAVLYRDSLEAGGIPRGTGPLVPNHVRTIDALLARQSGANARALAILDQNDYGVWYQHATASSLFSQGIERFLHAMALEDAGKIDEAKIKYGTMFDTNVHDRALWVPAHLRLAQIAASRGEMDDARGHYRRALALLVEAEPESQPLVDEVRAALNRLGS